MYYYQNTIVAVALALPILATITVVLRFQTRVTQKHSLQADDWAILVALIFALADAVLRVYAVYAENYGNLLTNYTPDQLVFSFKFLYVDVILIMLILGLIKISVVLFYKRIFSSAEFAKRANIFLGLCVAWTIGGVVPAIFRSNPISAYWENMGQVSLNFGAWNMSMAVLDIVLDLSILALPLPVIRKLNISTKKKISVMGIFLLGIFCVVSSAVRLYYAKFLNDVDSSPAFVFEFPERATYITNSAAMWSQIECSASIITVNLPTLVPVAQKFQAFNQSVRSWVSASLLGHRSSRNTGFELDDGSAKDGVSLSASDANSNSGAVPKGWDRV